MFFILLAAIVLLEGIDLLGSGPVGIYGIIEKIVFEPNEAVPERLQVWGAFAFVDGGPARDGAVSPVKRGYLYFKLPGDAAKQSTVKIEWADLKSVAGTGQAIGFGNWGYIGSFSGLESRTPSSSGPPYFLELYPGGGQQTDVRVRPASEAPATPAVYQTNAGIVKLPEQGSHAQLVKQLKDALKPRL